tara:strand:- start:1023 stop:1559 length:537 start_codon:yes stop_codon:yes gene_type:complete
MSCVRLFFEENYEELLKVSKRYVQGYGGDLLHDLAVYYLEEPRPLLEELCKKGELKKYICRTMAICSFSKTTRFYYKYKKHTEKIVNYPAFLLKSVEDNVEKEYDTAKTMKHINSILQDMDWFNAEVFRIYYLHSHSLKTLSNATGISKSTLYNALKKAQEEVKEKIKGFRRLDREND